MPSMRFARFAAVAGCLLFSVAATAGEEAAAPADAGANPAASTTSNTSTSSTKPNIVLIMSTDQGWGDAGYMGHPSLKTPNLDAMAKAGLVFSRFYAGGANPIPSRVAALTGEHPARFGSDSLYWLALPPETTTLAEVLQAAGYRTGQFGIWELGALDPELKEPMWSKQQYAQALSTPAQNGFDTGFSTRSYVPTFDPMVFPAGWDVRGGVKPGEQFPAAYWDAKGARVTENVSGDDSRVIMDRVVPFVRGAAKQKQPFFAAVWFHTPHTPIVAGPEQKKQYAALPENGQHYFGCITAMDEQIGRLRATLTELGVEQDTLIMFCSSSGPRGRMYKLTNGSTGGLRGRKNDLYEGGIRVPAIAVWPGVIEAGRASDAMTGILDFMPTVLDLLQLPWPEGQPKDGESIVPLLRVGPWVRSQPLFFTRNHWRALVTPTHKLVSEDDGAAWSFFDLTKDPGERMDVSRTNAVRKDHLLKVFQTWYDEVAAAAASTEHPPTSGGADDDDN